MECEKRATLEPFGKLGVLIERSYSLGASSKKVAKFRGICCNFLVEQNVTETANRNSSRSNMTNPYEQIKNYKINKNTANLLVVHVNNQCTK